MSGFTGLILLKLTVVLAAFLFLFLTTLNVVKIFDVSQRKKVFFWPLAVSFVLSIFIFISRTDVRPEIFSFVILAFFLWALFRAKYLSTLSRPGLDKVQGPALNWLWFLPVAQLLWVNLHIYFFIGPLVFLFFLIDRAVNKKIVGNDGNVRDVRNDSIPTFPTSPRRSNSSNIIWIFILVVLATLINPAGVHGALLPFNVLKEYGYSIVENQTLTFLTDFLGFNLSIFIFKLSVAVLILSFLLTVKKVKQRIFEIIISAFFIYVGFRMLRNLPLYAIASFPVLAILLADVFGNLGTKLTTSNVRRIFDVKKYTDNFFKVAVVGFLVFMLFFVASGGYYKWASLSKKFGFSVPNGLERAVDFVKENKIKGPMFNNFDIGGYLIWRFFPEERVFVDNRPEAYSVKFFEEIYKPMQESKEKWAEFSEKYGINFVFFDHMDATPWGQAFLRDIVKNPDWKIIYVNEDAVILVKNNKDNSGIISGSSITEETALNLVSDYIKYSSGNGADVMTTLAGFFYNVGWRKTAIGFAEEAMVLASKKPQAYLYKGLAHAYYPDKENQKLAAENIKKAIDLGLKDSRHYYILGVVYMNLGRLDEARTQFIKALEIDKDNEQAKEFLNKYFNE
ncbi:MAG: hypothetical protein HYW77_00520 [Parcubacteria group bacterium]|nr:hypothetical protein [Parcubacteria group bacterium]